MTDISNFESRTGILSSRAEDVFEFVTDIRNFERFIPKGTISNWNADKESCSFSVAMLGSVSMRISEKLTNSKVVYKGDALKKNDFLLVLSIAGPSENPAEVKISLNADLDPMMKMMAAKPISQFLEMLINEMENFRGWKELRE